MATHRIYQDLPLAPGPLVVLGEEAQHAIRVKRVAVGDRVEVLDGRGSIAAASVSGIDKGDAGRWRLILEVKEVRMEPPPRPRVEVLSAAPKGPRLEDMIDSLSQVGAASWALLQTDRGEVDPRPAKLDRLHRVAAEASKQCGRAWLLEVGAAASLGSILDRGGDSGAVVLADAAGAPYKRSGAAEIRLLVGPEGGWSPSELEQARRSGATIAGFGVHTMRIETAAVAAAAIIMHAELGRSEGQVAGAGR